MADNREWTVREAGVALRDNVSVAVYDVDELRACYPAWDDLSKDEKKRRCKRHEPVREGSTHNITCVGWHEYLPKLLNFKHDYEQIVDHPSEIALGTGTAPTGGFSVGDTELANEVGRIDLTDPSNTLDDWECDELVSSVELTDYELSEMGIVSESGVLYNHAELSPTIPSGTNRAGIIHVTVPFGDQSEI